MIKNSTYDKAVKRNQLLNRLFKLILFLTTTGFMMITINELQPSWLSSYTQGYSILKVSMSVLLFGMFASLNTCILLIRQQIKSR